MYFYMYIFTILCEYFELIYVIYIIYLFKLIFQV